MIRGRRFPWSHAGVERKISCYSFTALAKRAEGVHPEPPGPIQDAEDRDAELLIVAREMRDDGHASIVAGDLNDVAWSRTTSRFQSIAKALDPRRGRGFYATFHADYWIARWPIDHLFHTREFSTATLAVLPHIGSDHFPVFARLCWSRRDAETDKAGI